MTNKAQLGFATRGAETKLDIGKPKPPANQSKVREPRARTPKVGETWRLRVLPIDVHTIVSVSKGVVESDCCGMDAKTLLLDWNSWFEFVADAPSEGA